MSCLSADPPPPPRDALEGKGPQRRSQKRLDRRLEEVVNAVRGGYRRLQMPLTLALAVKDSPECPPGPRRQQHPVWGITCHVLALRWCDSGGSAPEHRTLSFRERARGVIAGTVGLPCPHTGTMPCPRQDERPASRDTGCRPLRSLGTRAIAALVLLPGRGGGGVAGPRPRARGGRAHTHRHLGSRGGVAAHSPSMAEPLALSRSGAWPTAHQCGGGRASLE